MGDDLNSAENARNKRLRSLEWLLYGVGVVAWTVMGAAMWNPGEYWSRSGRHGLMVFSWLVYACFGACRLILMRRRSEGSQVSSPSAFSTLGLSEGVTRPTDPVCSDHQKSD
jgi:hypothetical protein